MIVKDGIQFIEDASDSEYKECVKFKHVYVNLSFGIYPVPQLYIVGEFPEHEIYSLTVYLDEEDNLCLDGMHLKELFNVCEDDLDGSDRLLCELYNWLSSEGIKLYQSDYKKVYNAIIRILKKRFNR